MDVQLPGLPRSIRPVGTGVDIQLDVPPWHRRPLHTTPRIVDGVELGTWELVWSSRTVHVGEDGEVADAVGPAPVGPQAARGRWQHVPDSGFPWLDAHWLEGPPIQPPPWSAGWVRGGPRRRIWDRPVLVIGRDPATGISRPFIDVGSGSPGCRGADGEDFWLVVDREVDRTPSRLRSELIRVAGSTGTWSVLADLSTIDLGGHGWPLGSRPVDAASYERAALEEFGSAAQYWRSEGKHRPLVDDLTDVRAELLGTWPDTVVRLSFALGRTPGRRYVHAREVWGERGEPALGEYDLLFLHERLSTGMTDVREGSDGELLV
ncbi:hypothetical protein [Nakamurella leprariae]|uniref:Uncharacterized protein n=1 Tax=Nakamurella leprariae TaxID=2803911 RepID=A0A938YAT7_9ACTN|nr:hypothetical protein [Nakamurella leprariae]MBM9466191.1 hypothetical protein [Nakamurella leprariae]